MLALRIFPGWEFLVKPDGEFRLAAPDAYYHFRQSSFTLENFPRINREDDHSFYPAVIRDDAAGLYNITLAALAKVLSILGLEPSQALWWVCLLFPPLAASSITLMVFYLVRPWGGHWIALTMALWYVLIPGLTLAQMTIGICDHHVVEMWFGVLCIWQLQRLIQRDRDKPRAWWQPAWLAALPLALLQFTWLGGPTFLVILGLAMVGQFAADILAGVSPQRLIDSNLRYWSGFLIPTAAVGWLIPNLVLQASVWKATVGGTLVLWAALVVLKWYFGTSLFKLGPIYRMILVGMVAVSLGWAAITYSSSVQYFYAAGLTEKSSLVSENQPVTKHVFFGVTGMAGILGLLAPLVGILSGVWRRPGWWIGVFGSLLFIILWVRTFDYGYQAALHAVLLTGYGLGALGMVFSSKSEAVRLRRMAPTLVAATIAVIALRWPAQITAPWWLEREWYEAATGMPHDGWIEAMSWMRTSAPPLPERAEYPTAGQLPRGREGVLTDWVSGHLINTLGGRPATASRYPVSGPMTPFLLRSEEAVRAASLQNSTVAEAVRYVAVDRGTITFSFYAHLALVGLPGKDYYGRFQFTNRAGQSIAVPTLGEAYDNAFATHLLLRDGNDYSHFRLVFESELQSFVRLAVDSEARIVYPISNLILTRADAAKAREAMQHGIWKEGNLDAYLGNVVSAVKIFEQVKGAVVEGMAPPNAEVVLSTPLVNHTTGRSWVHRISGESDANGIFALTTPYPTEPVPNSNSVATGPAILELSPPSQSEDATPRIQVELTIRETEVQQGKPVSWDGKLGIDSSTP